MSSFDLKKFNDYMRNQDRFMKDLLEFLKKPRTVPKIEKSILSLATSVRLLADNVDKLQKSIETHLGDNTRPDILPTGGKRHPDTKRV